MPAKRPGTTKGEHPLIKKANERIKRLKEERRKIYDEMKPLRERIKKDQRFKDAGKKLSGGFVEKCKSVAKVKNTGLENSPVGLSSDTANRILANDFRAARDKALKNPRTRLRFHRFDGTGYFFYRFRRPGAKTDGMSFDELFQKDEKDNRAFVLTPLNAVIGKGKNAGKPAKHPRYELRAKMSGGNKREDKLYVRFVLILHRPLPEGAQINNAQIIRTRTGNRFSYTVCLTVHAPDSGAVRLDGGIGVDLNWRWNEKDETIEVATVAYEDGRPCRVVRLPGEIVRREGYIKDRRGDLDESATKLGEEIKKGIANINLPDGHGKAGLLKSAANQIQRANLSYETAFKLAGWAIHEPDVFSPQLKSRLRQWRGKYGRTYRECHNLRRKILAHRKDFYRCEADKMVKEKKEIVLEEIDLSQLAEFRDRDDTLSRKARRNRFLAAPGEFRSIVKNAALREGVPVTDAPPYNTSKKCSVPVCNKVNKGLTSEAEWTCSSCGAVHNRDENAAKNILKLRKHRLK